MPHTLAFVYSEPASSEYARATWNLLVLVFFFTSLLPHFQRRFQ